MSQVLIASRIPAACALLILLAGGCASTANPFVRLAPDYSELPLEALQAAAADIEEAVATENRDYTARDASGVVTDTPDIKQAIRQRAARHALVVALLDQGHASEQASGLLTLLNNKEYRAATTKRQRDRDALVIYSENQNRWTLYEGIMKASNYPPRSLSAIQETFFKARLVHLKPGHPRESL